MSHTHNQSNYHKRVVSLTLVLALAFSSLLSTRVGIATAQTAGPSWTYTGNLNAARRGPTATLLPNGKVLVVGGFGKGLVGGGYDATSVHTAELYDPSTGTWSLTGNLNEARADHTATLLPNGKVLVAGSSFCDTLTCHFNSAELYDPDKGTWSVTGDLNRGGGGRTATLLPSGKVLVVGSGGIKNAELYDPASGRWSITGDLPSPYGTYPYDTATLLSNGKVLVASGAGLAALYDPVTGTWSNTGYLHKPHYDEPTATLLPNGKVLLVGGCVYDDDGWCHGTISAESYDPATGTWSTTGNLNQGRAYHTATLLPNGKVLVAGGEGYDPALNSAELYDPSTETWSYTANLNALRWSHTATLLPGGKVLIAGGGPENNTAELYDSAGGSSAVDDPRFFVSQHYRDFLNRQPDPDGLDFWTSAILTCGSDPQCIEVKRINTSAAFFLSIEFQDTGYLVYRFYKSSFGNLSGAPVPVRFEDFLPDAQQIGQGVIVNQAGWQTVLENNKQSFANEFVQRSKFTSAYPPAMSPEAFVDTLFSNAGITPTSDDRNDVIAEFSGATNTSDVAARARALRRVAENPLLAEQEFNRAFVLMQYFGYLRRNPNDAPDANFAGYNFWLDKLNTFKGDFVQAEMVKAFLVSTEYRQRFRS